MSIKGLTVAVIAVALAMAILAPSAGAWTRTVINPCSADAETSCEVAAARHEVYAPTPPARGQLVIHFHGTFGRPSRHRKISEFLADQGFHVMTVKYPANTTAASACPNAVEFIDPDCFRRFRSESVFGENVADPAGQAFDHAAISVSKADSVLNRILKLGTYLSDNHAADGWQQFQVRDAGGTCTSVNATYGTCNIRRTLAGLGGHSQGSGVALYLSKFYDFRQVAMLSGPQDTWSLSAANWIAEGGFATPSSKMWGFSHTGDGEFAGQTLAWDVLGLPGALTDQGIGAPWGGSHRITTSLAPACASPTAEHGSTVTDSCTPGDPPTYQPIWLASYGG